jgi:DNA polymerase III epsilon subunit-like protein
MFSLLLQNTFKYKTKLLENKQFKNKNNLYVINNIMKKNINTGYKIFIDTETNGLPITKGFDNYNHPKELRFYNNSRLIEIAYIIYDNEGNKIKEVENLVIPNGFKITNSKFHGITEANCIKNGKQIDIVLNEFMKDLNNVDTIIAHNTLFDIHIILSECFRAKQYDLIDNIQKINKEDTMRIGKDFMKVNKYPKLTELYDYLYKTKIHQDHRALSDVIYCAKCYYKMR